MGCYLKTKIYIYIYIYTKEYISLSCENYKFIKHINSKEITTSKAIMTEKIGGNKSRMS